MGTLMISWVSLKYFIDTVMLRFTTKEQAPVGYLDDQLVTTEGLPPRSRLQLGTSVITSYKDLPPRSRLQLGTLLTRLGIAEDLPPRRRHQLGTSLIPSC